MKAVYKDALVEVKDILINSDENILSRIPNRFKLFIDKNMSKNYTSNINFNNKDWKNKILPETRIIIALIYRDYLVSKEKRDILIEEEKDIRNKIEKEKNEEFNTDNLFKKKQTRNKEEEYNASNKLVVIEKKSWYKVLIDKIMKKIRKI